MIKGLFFDVGGTLYSYSRYPDVMLSVCQQVRERHSLGLSAEELVPRLMEATKAADVKFTERSFYLFQHYFEEICRQFFAKIELSSPAEEISWCSNLMENGLVPQLELKPDCHQTLASLKAQGLYTSVVSNSDIHQLDTLIERGNLAEYFDHITSSEAAASCKPDKGFFEVALNKSGLDPEQVLFIGDSLEQDIAGAKSVGIKTVLITEEGMITPMHIGGEAVEPDFRITELSELLTLVGENNN